MADKETGHENEMSFESALENYLNPDFGDLEEGSITKGEIVRVDDDNVLVDVNFKSEGQIPASEFRDAAGNMTVSVGDRVDVYVVRKNEMEGTITLSFEKAKRMQVLTSSKTCRKTTGSSRATSCVASRAATPWTSAGLKLFCLARMWTCVPCPTWTLWSTRNSNSAC